MSKHTFGNVEWNSVDVTPQGGGGGNDFKKLKDGFNIVRVMTNPYQFSVNWLTTPDGKKRKIYTPISSPELVKKLEASDFRSQRKWFVTILDREDDKFKLLEIGSQIFQGIQDCHDNPSWGDVTQYDVTIKKGKRQTKTGEQTFYSVQGNPPISPLTQEQLDELAAFKERCSPEKFTNPTEPEEVCSIMQWDMSEFVKTAEGGDAEEEEDYDFDFDGLDE